MKILTNELSEGGGPEPETIAQEDASLGFSCFELNKIAREVNTAANRWLVNRGLSNAAFSWRNQINGDVHSKAVAT
jgi:hypothetical protein